MSELPPPVSGDANSTRDALLDAAEELFVASGIDGVSIRSVNKRAGFAPAAVHYHFGTKEALVEAVLRRKLGFASNQYWELVAKLELQAKAPTPTELIVAFAEPFISMIKESPVDGLRWLKFVVHLVQVRDQRLTSYTGGPGGINEALIALVHRSFPHLSPSEAALRWQIASSTVLRLLADADLPVAHLPDDESKGISWEYIEAAVQFAAHGLEGSTR